METGKMLQLEPMPALERRWIHLTLRDNPAVATFATLSTRSCDPVTTIVRSIGRVSPSKEERKTLSTEYIVFFTKPVPSNHWPLTNLRLPWAWAEKTRRWTMSPV